VFVTSAVCLWVPVVPPGCARRLQFRHPRPAVGPGGPCQVPLKAMIWQGTLVDIVGRCNTLAVFRVPRGRGPPAWQLAVLAVSAAVAATNVVDVGGIRGKTVPLD
jgi:hypothetical protein